MKIEIQEGSNFREVSYAALPSSPYSEVAHNSSAFAGMIAPFAGPADKIPSGWLLCDGRTVSRTEYQNLYNAIGVAWGKGNGSTTFNLPDLRGMFLRGVSGTSGNDLDADSRVMLTNNGGNTGNNVGSYQSDAIRNITGQFNGEDFFNLINGTTNGAFYALDANVAGNNDGDNDNALIKFDASRVVPTGSDNRPKNVYVTYIIKY
jgi:microcystin-dependent protein